jgi:hypothetical protein
MKSQDISEERRPTVSKDQSSGIQGYPEKIYVYSEYVIVMGGDLTENRMEKRPYTSSDDYHARHCIARNGTGFSYCEARLDNKYLLIGPMNALHKKTTEVQLNFCPLNKGDAA